MTPELWINLIAPGIIIPLGTLGNGLALWTLFFSTILKHRVASIFLITLYLADTSSILSGYLGQWIVNLSKTDISSLYAAESITYLNNTGIQYIECQPGDGFVILFVYHYVSFTVSALVMAALTIERVIVVFSPFQNNAQKDQKPLIILIIIGIIITSILIYLPMVFTSTQLYWNPDTGNFDLHGKYPTWSLSIAMLSAFAVIFPANVALLIKLHKEHRFRRSNSDQSHLNMEDDNPGCAPPILRTIDLKMTIVLIGISIAFILLTIPHRFLVVNATLNNLRIEELPVAITRQFCHINFSCNSIFYFFLASECREELRKTCSCK